MSSLGKHITILFLFTFSLLLASNANALALSSTDIAGSSFDLEDVSALVEHFPGVAKVVRFDNQALFILEKDFVWEITELTDSAIELRLDSKILAVVSAMQPGDYLVSPDTKSREIQYIEIDKNAIYIETSILEGRASDNKGQFVGDYSWPYDLTILDIDDQVLIDTEIDGIPVVITANHLFIEMSGDLLFGYNFDLIPPDILYLLMEFDSVLTVTIDYTAMVGGAVNHNFDLLNFSIPVYTIGYATINVTVALPTQLTTDGPVCLGGGLSFSYGYAVGIEALSGDVTPIWTTEPGNFSNLDPSYGAEADANLKVTIDIGVAATVGIPDVIELADAAFEIGVYANTIGTVAPCNWALDAGVDANLAFTEFTGVLCGPGECDWTLFDASIYSDIQSCDNLTDNCECNDLVCPVGCCDGRQCNPGNTDGACGADGEACIACGSDQHCVDGNCVAACDSELCPNGCCDGTTCRPGDTDAKCGEGGMACAPCADNQQCVGQECREMCDANLCPAGCCNGKQCLPGDTNEFCGAEGTVCQACTADMHCEDGDCVPGIDDDDNNDNNDDNDDNDDISIDDDASPADQGDDSEESSGSCGC